MLRVKLLLQDSPFSKVHLCSRAWCRAWTHSLQAPRRAGGLGEGCKKWHRQKRWVKWVRRQPQTSMCAVFLCRERGCLSPRQSPQRWRTFFHISIELHILKGFSNPSQLSKAFSFQITQANIMQQPQAESQLRAESGQLCDFGLWLSS